MKPYYEQDGIVIYHADCREVLPTLPKVDLVLTDPPYGIGESAAKNRTRVHACAPRDYGDALWDAEPIPQALFDAIESAGKYAIIWGGNYYITRRASCWLVWDKDNTGDFADCELAYTNLPWAVRRLKYRWNGMLQEPGTRKEQRQHLTQKPVALMRWCIGLAKNTQTILDPFMGSGTTLVAAQQLGLSAIGIEIEERYCEIAAERLRQRSLFSIPTTEPESAQDSLFIVGG